MNLSALRIRNFKSLYDVAIEGLGNLNIFVGTNNSGKSAIFLALELLKDQIEHCRLTNSPSRFTSRMTSKLQGGVVEVELEFSLTEEDAVELLAELLHDHPERERAIKEGMERNFLRTIRYHLAFRPDTDSVNRTCLRSIRVKSLNREIPLFELEVEGDPPKGRFLESLREIPYPKVSPIEESISAAFEGSPVGHVPKFNDLYREPHVLLGPLHSFIDKGLQIVSPLSYFSKETPKERDTSSLELKDDGSNLPSVLKMLSVNESESFQRYQKLVQELIPRVMVRPHIGTKEDILSYESTGPLFKEETLGIELDTDSVGMGIRQVLILAMHIHLSGQKEVRPILMEEPELYLHPSVQRRLLSILKRESDRRQIFLTTQSATLVDRVQSSSTYLFRKPYDQTQVLKISDHFEEITSELGIRKTDMLLPEGCVIVEGPSDGSILSKFAETLGTDFDEISVNIVQADGWGNMEYYVNAEAFDLCRTPFLAILDSHRESKKKIMDQLIGNERGKKALCKPDQVHILKEYSIESYILHPKAIAEEIRYRGLSKRNSHRLEEEIQRFLEANKDKKNKANVLNELFLKHGGTYKKTIHGPSIASKIPKEDIHEEIKYIINKIESLVHS